MNNLRITIALTVTAAAVAFAPAGAQAASVCNEASNSQNHRGDYVTTGTPDPTPPARNKLGLAPVGNGKGVGLENAASHSPALSPCGLPGDGGPTSGGDLT